MTNTERIQANNAELREAIEIAEGLPDGGYDNLLVDMCHQTITGDVNNDNVTRVGDYTFYNNTLLQSVVFQNATSVGNYAFQNCTSLTDINLPKVTTLGYSAFSKCTNLIVANMPLVSSLTSATMGYHFQDCSKLESVNMPLLPTIPTAMFYNCQKIASADFPLATEVGSQAFFQNRALTRVNLPLVTKVGSYAFQYCYALATACFNSLKTVASYAFYGCDIQIFDSPFESIAASAFSNCYYLKALVIRNTSAICTLANTNAFDGCPRFLGTVNSAYNPNGLLGYIYVPSALIDSYKTATNWTTYASQFRALEDYTVDGTVTGALDESKI